MWGVLSTSELMTLPSVSRLRLMLAASRARMFSEPAFRLFSDPARSTKFNFPVLITASPFSVCLVVCTLSVKIQWERLWFNQHMHPHYVLYIKTYLECSLQLVAAVILLRTPIFMISIPRATDEIWYSWQLTLALPFSSNILNDFWLSEADNRSLNSSL